MQDMDETSGEQRGPDGVPVKRPASTGDSISTSRAKKMRSHHQQQSRHGAPGYGPSALSQSTPDSEILSLFRSFSERIDAMNDKRERIIKISRDITIQSKRIISHLQRITSAPDKVRILKEAHEKRAQVVDLFREVARELRGPDEHKYRRAVQPGFEEFIEACSFLNYLEKGTLITKPELEALLADEENRPILEVPAQTYVLGVADLTGELMRYCINTLAQSGIQGMATVEEVCRFMRSLESDYTLLNLNNGPVSKKMGAMRASRLKVENACYTLKIRGAEYPPERLLDSFQIQGAFAGSSDLHGDEHADPVDRDS
ncbi:Translin [Gaertneriomyces semiglobifer]|nr:Translin [Gaertneriomyces semiglobifer]